MNKNKFNANICNIIESSFKKKSSGTNLTIVKVGKFSSTKNVLVHNLNHNNYYYIVPILYVDTHTVSQLSTDCNILESVLNKNVSNE